MALWAIVPVKPLRRGKSRLAGALSNEERAELNRKLLSHTVDTLAQISEIDQILVISRDPEALSIARDKGARTVREDGAPHLNVALARATAVAQSYNANRILVIPADLPQLDAQDIITLIQTGKDSPCVVIAPDHSGQGTNALFINPTGLIEYSFGENSYQRHVANAQTKGANVLTCKIESFARDVDLPDDLEFLDHDPALWNYSNGYSENGSKNKKTTDSLQKLYENMD